jgi:tetratricopeptide (TPR) repeat protein
MFGAWHWTLHLLRRFDEERALLDRRLALSPNNPDLIISKARIYQMTGDLEMAAKLVQPLLLQPLDSVFGKFQLDQWMYERRYQKVIAAIQGALRQPASQSDEHRGFDLVALGQVQKLSGDDRAARASFLAARDILERERRQNAPDDIDFVINLVFVHVGLGDREAALREAERSVTLAANDALTEPSQQVLIAQIHAQFGDADAALRDLPRLLQTPASDITPAQLRLDPIWDPIRKDPRFQKLCTEKSKP